MAFDTTMLATLLRRMRRFQSIASAEEADLIEDIDSAIRFFRRKHHFPWTLKQTTLRVFPDVLEYPVAEDHDALAYLDSSDGEFEQKMRPKYTSLIDFYQDPDNRSLLAELWDGACQYLGIRDKSFNTGSSIIIDSVEVDSGYTLSGDATTKTLDTVYRKKGNNSLRVTVVASTGSAGFSHTFTALNDSLVLRKYYFRYVYLSGLPDSITLRFGSSASAYYSATVTTQFSGQAFKINAWNLVAFDLNAAAMTGTVNTASLAYEAFFFTNAPSGTYYFDESSIKAWELADYWYYSKYIVLTAAATSPDSEYFLSEANVYSTADMLVGDTAFADCVMYDACLTSVSNKLQDAFTSLLEVYPDMEPLISTNYYRLASNDGPLVQAYYDGANDSN